jgi:hypothetical protein
MKKPICTGCNRHPEQIEEYLPMAVMEKMTADEIVIATDGTYNAENGHFLCTECYIKAGCPSGPGRGWKAP